MGEEYKIQTEAFQGPLDLLLNLVEKRRFFINDISLSKVADDFLTYVKNHDNFSINKTANFILIASTLVLIKSKSLFPELKLTEDEEESIEELEKRLSLYRKFKELSLRLKFKFERKLIFQRRKSTKKIQPVFSPEKTISQESMRLSLVKVLQTLPKPNTSRDVSVRAVVSLEKMISNLTQRVMATSRMSFKDYAKESKNDRPTMVVSFLAILELVHEGTFIVQQSGQFEDIYFEKYNDTEIGAEFPDLESEEDILIVDKPNFY